MSKVALAAALGLLLFFTWLTGIRPAYAFAYALCLLFVVAWAWPRIAIRGMTFTRSLNPGTPTVGESFEEAIEVRRTGWVPAPWVEVRDLSQIPDYQPGRVISVSGDLVKWKSRGVYRRRGWIAFGPTSLRVREPFGLFDKELKLTQRTSVLVYPRVRPIPDLLTPSAQQVGNSPSFGAWADYPPETGGVRDYTTGDSFGRIHWALSARHGRLMSKTFEQPLTTDLWILLDLDRNVHCGRRRGVDGRVRREPRGVDGLAGPQQGPAGWADRERFQGDDPRAAPRGPAGSLDPRLPRSSRRLTAGHR